MRAIIFRTVLTHDHTTTELKTHVSDPFIMSLGSGQHANETPNDTDN